MPHAADTESESRGKPSHEASARPSGTTPKPGTRGALFRALVDAGADAVVAYNAEEQAQSMVSESVATQVQPMLVEMRRLFGEQSRQIAALTAVVTGHDEKLSVLTELVTRHDEKLDGLKRELRLIWGALGVLVTLLTVVFGFVFRG